MDFPVIPEALTWASAGFLLVCSLVTSMITASLGAGGGVLLLVLLALWLPPAAIIPVHGMIQLGSNAGRVSLTLRHVNWRVIAAFLPGVLIGAAAGSLLLIELPPVIWQLTIAAFVLYLCWGPGLPKQALGSAGVLLASAITSFASLFVGASGPLVAAFIKQIPGDRFATVSTFACAMTLQHAPKALIFSLAGFVFHEWAVFVLAMIGCGFVGTWLGLKLLNTLSNKHFHRAFTWILTLLAARLIWQALASSL
ncbi:sulfite exporter TauE/SafE family protein [Marinobacter salicampi]|uniref:sulfite exporter TauE/SafE family protein n=1 Tax=Marinobacter salicampi TaxID=435907 RepID=UPI001A93C478|nr:sulfite exporter TauE/SafE family protein [Marinobacter salicampi]